MKRPLSPPRAYAVSMIRNYIRNDKVCRKRGRYDRSSINTMYDSEFERDSYYAWALGQALYAMYKADPRYESPLDVLEGLREKYDRWAHYESKNAESYSACVCAIDNLIDLLLS